MGIPNAEKVLADYLRSVEDMPRVVNKTPSEQTDPWVRLTMLGAPSETEPVDHLIRFMFQVDVVSGNDGGRPEANALGIFVREVLKDMPGQTEDAVTTGVECINDSSANDSSFTPPREYRTQTYYIYMH